MRLSLFFAVFYILAVLPLQWASAQQDDGILRDIYIFEQFGDVSAEDLQKTADHQYPYEFLTKKSSIETIETDRGIVASIDYLVRIKVYSSEPIEIAQASLVGIPYYFADGIEKIENIEGITHHIDGTKTPLNLQNLRTADLNSRYRILEFEMPNAGAGDILEYKYTLERRYIEELPDFHISHRVPTENVELYFKNSDFIRYDAVSQNVDFSIEYEEHRVDTSSIPLVFTYNRPDPVFIQTWKAEQIDAVDASNYISSIDDVRSKLQFQISEFGLPRQPLENSWEFVTAQILRNDNPYHSIELAPSILEEGREIASLYTSKEEVQDSVFARVNSSVQFSGQTAIFADRGLQHVLSEEPSNQAEINLALLGMLRGAGIDAAPLYLSGRNFGRINPDFPSLFQFNSMMVVSEINEKTYFMDASFPHSIPNLIPVNLYNGRGMAISDSTHTWLEISPEKSTFKLDITIRGQLLENGDLTGTIQAESFGYPSQQIRQKQATGLPNRDIVMDTFFDIYPNMEFEESNITIDPNDNNQVEIEAGFRIPDYAITFSEGIEFRPMVVGYLFDNPFQSTERRVPVTLDAPELLSIKYSIELPSGYTIDVSGETRSTGLDGAFLFEEYITEGNRLEYAYDIEINRKEFPADVYSQLRRIYERWVNLSNNTWFIENS